MLEGCIIVTSSGLLGPSQCVPMDTGIVSVVQYIYILWAAQFQIYLKSVVCRVQLLDLPPDSRTFSRTFLLGVSNSRMTSVFEVLYLVKYFGGFKYFISHDIKNRFKNAVTLVIPTHFILYFFTQVVIIIL
jgi:hypothetical protein